MQYDSPTAEDEAARTGVLAAIKRSEAAANRKKQDDKPKASKRVGITVFSIPNFLATCRYSVQRYAPERSEGWTNQIDMALHFRARISLGDNEEAVRALINSTMFGVIDAEAFTAVRARVREVKTSNRNGGVAVGSSVYLQVSVDGAIVVPYCGEQVQVLNGLPPPNHFWYAYCLGQAPNTEFVADDGPQPAIRVKVPMHDWR